MAGGGHIILSNGLLSKGGGKRNREGAGGELQNLGKPIGSAEWG